MATFTATSGVRFTDTDDRVSFTAGYQSVSGGGGAELSDATPQALGTASAGTATTASRSDHRHAMPSASDVGAAATSHVHAAADITSGTMATARLGSGTANSTTFLRGDQTYAAPTVDVLSNFASERIAGRATAGSGDSEELTAAQVRSLLGSSWTKIADRTIAAGGSASENFDVTGYTIVQILFAGNSERASTVAGLYCTFNNNTGSVYSTDSGALTTFLQLGSVPGANTNTDRFGMVRAEFHLLDNFIKSGFSTSTNIASTATVGTSPVQRGLYSSITAAVTSLQITTQSGDIAAGSRIIVLGM